MATRAIPTRGGYLLTPSPVRAALAVTVRVTDKAVNWHVPADTPTGHQSAYAPHLDRGVHHQRAYERACRAKIEHIMQRDNVSRADATPLAVALVNSQRRTNTLRWAGCRNYITREVI